MRREPWRSRWRRRANSPVLNWRSRRRRFGRNRRRLQPVGAAACGGAQRLVTGLKDRYSTGDLAKDLALGDALISWQMPHGGWWKNWESKYSQKWNGRERRSDVVVNGVEAGTIDNDATVKEILFLASLYKRTGEPRFKQAVLRGDRLPADDAVPKWRLAPDLPSKGGLLQPRHLQRRRDDQRDGTVGAREEALSPVDTDLIDATYAMRIDDALERVFATSWIRRSG